MKKNIFPDNFYWGASTSAHQVEGGSHNNWSQWELRNAPRLAVEASAKWSERTRRRFPEMFTQQNYISGKAADHYNLYAEDFDLAKKGGHNAHRFSIDWARIEPEEGIFDEKAIAHYRDVVKALRARGIEPFVTLWHWTHPLWLEDRGGVLAPDFPEKFAHYAHMMIDALNAEEDSSVRFVMTLNEPMSVISSCYITGAWPHTRKGVFAALRAYKNLSKAHVGAYSVLKKKHPDLSVGFTEILTSFRSAKSPSFFQRLIVRIATYWTNKKFIEMTQGQYDFLGVQYYFQYAIGRVGEDAHRQKSDLEWGLHAEGLYDVIHQYAQYDVPLYITEDGLADVSDDLRPQFLYDHIAQVERASREGVDIRGYFHWSLLDNFEWDKGYWPRFGLVEIDFHTQKRTPRKSFGLYRDIIKGYSE